MLTARGRRVGVLKSDAHRLKLDTPGKDSWRFREAGAHAALVLGGEQMGLFTGVEGPMSLGAVIDRYLGDVDLVLGEGFRKSGLPSVRVSRAGVACDPAWEPPANLVAWVSDAPIDTSLPVLPLGDPSAVADWIEAGWLSARPRERRVTVVFPCGSGWTAADVARGVDLCDRAGFGEPLFVAGHGARVLGARVVEDLRPGLGALGALLTGLAAVETPDVLLVGPRHLRAPPGLLAALAQAGPRAADVVAPVVRGFPEPLLALYGHRCLGAIQAALLSGERKVAGWWGQVRTVGIEEATWRAWDPDASAFGGA